MSMLDAKKSFIVSEAARQFSTKPVKDVTVKDIAAAAGVGEATVYRYFGTKGELIVACAEMLEREVYDVFIDKVAPTPAIKAIERFYGAYLVIFTERTYLYRFLSDFDAYAINEGVDKLDSYADAIDGYKCAFLEAYERGLSDGSVREQENIELFYYSTTHALISLCKKLASDMPVIRQDLFTEKQNEISTLISIIIGALRK